MRLLDPNKLADRLENEAKLECTVGHLKKAEEYATAASVLRSEAELHTIEAEPVRHGEWIYHHAATEGWKVCSVCLEQAHHPAGGDPYCHNCGAMMDGGGGA